MSCININACQLAGSPSEFPAQTPQLNKPFACTSNYLGTKLPKISMRWSSATSKYQQSAIVCSFGGKEKPGNGNEGSPWDALGKAIGNLKKEKTSIEDVLKQQIQKQEYYDDGGSGAKPPPGGGGGGGGADGFGEGAEDESFAGMWNEFSQVILATTGIVFVYIYIVEGEEITVIAKDFLKLVFKRQKSLRLTRLINQWKNFFESMREKEAYDPNWLEREIISTSTWYDSPAKYRYVLKALDSGSDDDDYHDARDRDHDDRDPDHDDPDRDDEDDEF